jgi:two-component system OmpR family response regulator
MITQRSDAPPAWVRVLVVDDDLQIGELVSGYVGGFGMACEVAASGTATRVAMRERKFDVVLLDLMLPDADGLELCRWMKADYPRTSVIMLTAQGDPMSRVVGLETGADDYLAKPFEPRELVARIKAVLRRGSLAAAPAAHVASFGRWRYDRTARSLEGDDGVVMSLSSLEHRLLGALIDHSGKVLTRERLLDLLHSPGADVSDRSIDLAISRLRSKLGGQAGDLIRTIRGEGYLFQKAEAK